jgi:cation diffusion facilitator CzcD-associated flavoprotein CzcO/acetyl esterase/lipase
MSQATKAGNSRTGQQVDFDAIVVGAGFSGLHMLHSLRKQGLSVKVYERGGGVGGTWYWNRYPGARCDSESVYYMFSDHLSEDILDKWTWTERYAAQPEILRYLDFVTDQMDLRRDIQFNADIVSAVYDARRNAWDVRLADGSTSSSRFLVTAVGCLSSTNTPKFPGIDTFSGESYHTGAWPHEEVDFTGKRVAVIGTGATAVQAVPEIAKQAAQVWVFQRTPNYDIPGRNGPLAPDYVAQVKAEYKDLWQKARESGFGLPYQVVERSAVDYSPEERQPIFEAAWAKGGFYMGLETFSDYLVNKESNDTVSEFVRGKIREIVTDPAVAELLAPKDHPFFTKRPPLENGYYEAFNRDNVTLLDARTAPIQEITPCGVRTGGREYEVDAIVYATGFDAMTGALFGMGITGQEGLRLQDKWRDGPRTYLGLTTHGFPNLFVITGPQSPSVLSNMPVAIEQNVEWIAGLIQYLRSHDLDVAEPTQEAEDKWVAHHDEMAAATLLLGTDSWWVGANIPGKPRTLYPYVGGVGPFRVICQEVAEKGYEGLALRQHGKPAGEGELRSRRDLIDPEARRPLDQLLQFMPGGFNAIPDIIQRRAAAAQLLAALEVPPKPHVLSEDRAVPGAAGAPDIKVRIYRPAQATGPLPGIYFIHGGGMILGDINGEDAVASSICEHVGAVVVSVEYRLAPEHPYPAPVEDCYAGLVWMARHAAELGFDPDRLAVYGGSAGGGLTIATTMLARDRSFPAVRFQMPIYPMIDDRNETPSSFEITDIGVWDRSANIEAWTWYLGDGKPDQYAAPSRAEDLAGLPPTFIDVGSIDLFRDEDIMFATRLMQAGVPTELHVNPGAYHAAEVLAPESVLSQRIWARRIDALRRALG